MQAMFEKYNSISVKYRDEDITETIIEGIIHKGYIDTSQNITYYDDVTGEELNNRELKYIVPWTILYKMNADAMECQLDELKPSHRSFIENKRLIKYTPSGEVEALCEAE